jgi:predicted nuclease of restriction endonuclease-like (RecB) superfamily
MKKRKWRKKAMICPKCAKEIPDKRGRLSMSNELTPSNNAEYTEIISIIERARENAFRAVNRELISMYWDIGKYVSEKVKSDGWGKSVVKDFSQFIQSRFLGIRGFSPQNIWRMKQYYETYRDNEKLSTLSREISWSNNVLIMMGAKTDEAREFYLILSQKDNYSARELERQMDSMLFERTMISDEKNKLQVAKSQGLTALRDNYILEFLDIPESHRESELRKAIIANLRDFILEFGKDFTLVGEEYRVQVGNTDFRIDLLMYNRELSCLVAIELKVTKFKPDYLGRLEFYLEALDRDVKKPNENPSVGLILCAGKDDAVVEYALSRSMSPALVADYQLHLPEKALLENKLRELTELADIEETYEED